MVVCELFPLDPSLSVPGIIGFTIEYDPVRTLTKKSI